MNTNLCPQCKHLKHPPIKDDGAEGCSAVVYLKKKKDGGYYHEHCDCDYDEKLMEKK